MTQALFTQHKSECGQGPFCVHTTSLVSDRSVHTAQFSPSGRVTDCAASHLELKYRKVGLVRSAPVGYSSFYVTIGARISSRFDIQFCIDDSVWGHWQGLKLHF